MQELHQAAFSDGILFRSQKHDTNHRKTKVNEMAKDFCEIDNNRRGVKGERPLPLSKELVQYCSQTCGNNQTQNNNRCRQRKL